MSPDWTSDRPDIHGGKFGDNENQNEIINLDKNTILKYIMTTIYVFFSELGAEKEEKLRQMLKESGLNLL